MDTKGTLDAESVSGHRYFVTIKEEHSRFFAVRTIKSKTDPADVVLRFDKYFDKQSGNLV